MPHQVKLCFQPTLLTRRPEKEQSTYSVVKRDPKPPQLRLSNCILPRVETLSFYGGTPDKFVQHNLGDRVFKETIELFFPLFQRPDLRNILREVGSQLKSGLVFGDEFARTATMLYREIDIILTRVEEEAAGKTPQARSASNLADWIIGIK